MVSIKDNGPIVKNQDLALKMLKDSLGEDDLLEVAPFSDQVFHGVGMAAAGDILFDNGPCIQIRGYIMAGGPYDLDTPFMGGMVGFGPRKCRQERVVYIDDPVGKPVDKPLAQDLHIAGKYDKIDAVIPEELEFEGFLFRFIFLCNRDMVKIDPEPFGHRLKLLVVTDDQGNLHVPLPSRIASQDVEKAMWHLGDKQRHPWDFGREMEFPNHLHGSSDQCIEVLPYLVGWDGKMVKFPLHPHVKDHLLPVDMLVEIDDIPLVPVQKLGDCSQDPLTIGTMDQQDGRVFLIL